MSTSYNLRSGEGSGENAAAAPVLPVRGSPIADQEAPVADLTQVLSALQGTNHMVSALADQVRLLQVRTPLTPPENPDDRWRIPVVDRRWRGALTVETYRLAYRADRLTVEEQESLSKSIKEITVRLSGAKFDGRDPASLLSFLDRFATVMRESNRSEAVALVVLSELLSGRPAIMFRTLRNLTYPGAIHWLLTTFAPEDELAKEWNQIRSLSLTSRERPSEFASRLQERVARLALNIEDADVRSIFETGLGTQLQAALRVQYSSNPSLRTASLWTLARTCDDVVLSTPDTARSTRHERPKHVMTLEAEPTYFPYATHTLRDYPSYSPGPGPFPTDSSYSPHSTPKNTISDVAENCQFSVYDDGEVMLLNQGDRPRCWVCCKQGHRLRDCIFLRHLTDAEYQMLTKARDEFFQPRPRVPSYGPHKDRRDRPNYQRLQPLTTYKPTLPQPPQRPEVEQREAVEDEAENAEAQLSENRP